MPLLDINMLRQVSGVGATTVRNFVKAGYRSLDDLQDVPLEQLIQINGVGESTAQAIVEFLQRTDGAGDSVRAYRYDETRKNIPPAGLAAQGRIAEQSATRYGYDPHLPPVLRFDDSGQADRLPNLLETAKQRNLTDEEAKLLAEALRTHQPWLEWTGKREKRWFEVDPVALHMHERISAEAIVQLARRQPLQREFFADPDLPFHEQVRFYTHDIDWTNRLILGDSLVVMNSLAKREDLAGKVQMIYIDPPYGIKFASNFQPFVNNRDVRDRDQDLTREPEQVKAYRDTWTLGIHSYLAYLRDRLTAAKELLKPEGSIFVQISDENVHRVRMLLDEVFGADNFLGQIAFSTTSSSSSEYIDSVFDYLLWYGQDRRQSTYFQLFTEKWEGKATAQTYTWMLEPSGAIRRMTTEERDSPDRAEKLGKIFTTSSLDSQTDSSRALYDVEFEGDTYSPGKRRWATPPEGMRRLIKSGRVTISGSTIRYIRFLEDYPVLQITNLWEDTGTGSFTDPKVYVVQTNTKVIERCILLTTRPGDLVLDPTCGSGTTAYVAEQWGRRWITIDTSRVAIALARQRLLTAKFDYYELAKPEDGVEGGFVCETVPHITLKSIAQNQALDPLFAKWEPVLAEKLEVLNIALQFVTPDIRTRLQPKLAQKERQEGKKAITDADQRRWLLPQEKWEEWEVPFDTDPDWPQELQDALLDYRQAWRQKMDEVNATIAASAPQETLVDRPQVVKNIVRVSGPFTVEGVQPIEERLDRDEADSPIGGEPEGLQTFEPAAGRDRATASAPSADPTNTEAYLDRMIKLLAQDGVRFLGNQQIQIERLSPFSGSASLHAEGEWNPQQNSASRRLAVSFGPQYGPLTAKQVEEALWEASRRGCEDIIFAGFDIDGAAQAAIEADPNPRIRCHLAHIRPDVLMKDLLKTTPASQLFTITGLPRIELHPSDEGYVVEMQGMDVYDPVNNAVLPTSAKDVAAWFLDSDYDGKTFFVTQAFFPDKTAWDKLARALKSVVDPEHFAAFSSTRSLPFQVGVHQRIAVKVIDPRGNEVMRVLYLNGQVRYDR